MRAGRAGREIDREAGFKEAEIVELLGDGAGELARRLRIREIQIVEHFAGVHDRDVHGVAGFLFGAQILVDGAVGFGEKVGADVEFHRHVSHEFRSYECLCH